MKKQLFFAGGAVLSAALAAGGVLIWTPLGWIAAPMMLAVAGGIAWGQFGNQGASSAEAIEMSKEERRQLQLAGGGTLCFITRALVTESPAEAGVACDARKYNWQIHFVYGDPSLWTQTDEPAEVAWNKARHPDDRQRCGMNFAQAIANGDRQMRQEFRIIIANGQIRWIDQSMIILPVSAGTWQVRSVYVDITERKKAEELLKTQQMQLRALIDNLPDAIYVKDTQSRFLVANNAVARLMGANSTDELLGRTDADFYPADRAREFMADEQRVIHEGVSLLNKDEPGEAEGSIRWITTNKIPLRDGAGRIVGLVGIGHDTTERKTFEESLKTQRMQLRTLIDIIPDAIYVKDTQSRFLVANNAAARLVGVNSPDELLGRTDADFAPADSARKFMADEQRVIHEGVSLLNKDESGEVGGSIRWITTNKIPLRDGAGRIVGLVGIGHDTTERKEMEESLRQSEARLREVLDATPFPIAVVDLRDNEIDFWSRSALTLFGHTAPTTDQWYQLAYPDPDYRSQVIQRWKPCLEEAKLSGQAVNTGEYQIACRDGSIRICEIYAAFIAERLIVTFRDITSRKQAEEAAVQSDDRLRQLMRQARCLIIEADVEAPEQWRQLKNPECFSWHIFGATDSIATQSLIDLDCSDPAAFFNVFVNACDPDHRHRMNDTFLEVALEGWRSYTQEYRVKNRHGQWRWFSETIHLTPLDANHWHAAGTIIDISDLRRAEDALAAEHQLLSSLISAIPDRVYFKDRESRFIRVNPAFLQSHSTLDQQTVLGKTDFDLFGEHARDALADEQRIMTTGQPLINKEEREDRSDGRITWALTTKMPLRDAAGDIVGVMGISRDNTEHKRAEQALQESHRKLHQLMQQAHCLVFEAAIEAPSNWRELKDEDFRFDWQFGTLDTDSARNLIDLDYSDTSGFFDALDKARGPVEFSRLYNLFSGAVRRDHHSYSHEYRIKNQSGHWQWFSETVHLEPIDGNHWHAAGAIADITDRKLAEDALVAEQKLLGSLISATPDNVYFKDRQSRFILVNEAHARHCGMANPQAAIGKTDFDLFGSHAAEAFADEQQIMATGQPLIGKEEREDRSDGQTAWVLSTKMPLRDSAGEIIGIMGISHNITEQKRAEQQIRQLNEELEQRVIERTTALETSNRELEAFSYSVSHDLRAPLRHIDGYVELLSRCREGLGKKDRHYLDTIADSARQMGRLIDDLLQFSRTGRTEMRQAGMDMNQAVQEALAAVQAGVSERTIEWVIADLPHVFGDYAMLRVVWTNLLSNAVKYTQPREQTRIEVGFCEEDGQQVFFVRDNGVGFDMQHSQNLFGVFQRLHSAESFEGTGIGLATVRRIVARHGGRTWAQAELDKGATFYFSLPNTTAPKEACREPSLCTGDKHP